MADQFTGANVVEGYNFEKSENGIYAPEIKHPASNPHNPVVPVNTIVSVLNLFNVSLFRPLSAQARKKLAWGAALATLGLGWATATFRHQTDTVNDPMRNVTQTRERYSWPVLGSKRFAFDRITTDSKAILPNGSDMETKGTAASVGFVDGNNNNFYKQNYYVGGKSPVQPPF